MIKLTTFKAKIVLVSLLAFVLFFSPIVVQGQYNYEYVNVTTKVNITNAFPEIQEVLVTQDITLVAGGLKTIYCNATIRDWNGYEDINTVNVTFYHNSTAQSGDPDSGNNHYTNSSCVETSNDGEFIAEYSCSLQLLYYTNPDEWLCNLTVKDEYNFTDSMENDTSINELYALNVTNVIDYGDLAVLDYSDNITATVSNLGNRNINVSVLGYGNETEPDFGLLCDYGGHIPQEYQRFAPSLVIWDEKTPLSKDNQDMGFMLDQSTDVSPPNTRDTFWQLFVPPNPFGECTGYLRFTATIPP